MVKAYTLRPEYEGTLVGGTVVTGVEAGSMDIREALDKGGGEIVTDDTMLQGILNNYYGEYGLVFNVAEVEGDERRQLSAVELGRIDPLTGAEFEPPPRRGSGTPPTAQNVESSGSGGEQGSGESQNSGESQGAESSETGDASSETGDAGDIPPAEHGVQSDYAAFTVDELKDTLNERGIRMPAKASQQALIEALEKDDNERQGAGSGS